MNIRSGLVMGTSGDEVSELHQALAVIGLQIEEVECETHAFGASTVAAVIKLQALAGIEQTGVVDENTLAVVSLALDRLGIRPGEAGYVAADAPFEVGGTVRDSDGLPLAEAKVLAFDCDLRERRQIGEGATDKQGAYRIAYKREALLDGHTSADLQVEARPGPGTAHPDGPPPAAGSAGAVRSAILFNAPRKATIDISLGGRAHEQEPEYASLIAKATPLLGKLTPGELQEGGEHRDLSFISGQTGISRERLSYWAAAERLAAQTELPAQLFYGLFRSGVPADAHVTALASSSEGVDLNANAKHLLEGVLSTSADGLRAALASAVAANVIAASYAQRAEADVQTLQKLANQAALSSNQGFGKTSLGSVLSAVAVPAEVQQRFTALYASAVGSGRRTFWRDLVKNGTFEPAQVADMRFGVTVGRLTRGHLPLIDELAAQRAAGKIKGARDLARLSAEDWKALLEKPSTEGKPIGAPTFIAAQSPELALATYADMLERFFTRTYPTSAFSARVAADQRAPFAATSATSEFLDANPAFDLRFTNIDAFSAKSEIPKEVRPTLLAAQRLVKLNSDYRVMSALMSDGISSAQQVYFMGPERFAAKYGSQPAFGATEAARTWARAEQTYGMALAFATRFNYTLGAASPAAVGETLPKDAAAQAAAFPNLQTLFGSDSLCACSECESVLGDGAYLADMLEFLSRRSASGGSNARDVLLARRLDIEQIELSCPNTNTALPYIDLVNELLEDAVAPPADPHAAARARQTTLTTPELNANPQYVNEDAYTTLAQAVYPWALPFDLRLAEARTYMGQLKLDRAQLIETFQKPAGYPSAQADAIARERLGLSALQADIVTAGPLAAGFQPWDHWGLAEAANTVVDPDDPTKTVGGSWIEVLSQARVLLARAGLHYQELARLLNTVFVNGDETLDIVCEPPGTCDVATMTISGLSTEALDRIHRFVRLWRCLGWDVYELDDAIGCLQSTSAAGGARLNDELLRQLACVIAAIKRYSLSVPAAVALFAPTPSSVTLAAREVPTLPGDEQRHSLYHDLFENLTVLNPPDPIFALDAAGEEIAAIGSAPKLADHTAALVAALEVSESDVRVAIEAFTDGNLSLHALAALYRHVKLADMLGVSIEELVKLLAIVEAPAPGAPFYEAVDPFDGTRPESLATFAALYRKLTVGGLSLSTADYIVRDVDDGSGKAPDPVAVGTLLLTLYNDLAKTSAEHASGLVVQTLAGALGLESATASLLLTAWLPSASVPGEYAIVDFLALASKPLADKTQPIPASDPEFAPYFTLYATLAKAALLIGQLKLGADDVKWWHASGVAAGWLDPTTLPTSAQASAGGRFHGLCRLLDGCRVRASVPVQKGTFATLFDAGSSKRAYVSGLAAATQWPEAALEVLCGDPENPADEGELTLAYPADYACEVALARIYPCMRLVQGTGIPADVSGWIAPAPTPAQADAVKQSVKARYPQEQWLTLAKQLRDPLRQSQRDALVAYLLAHPPAGVERWLDPDDVFAHFLIDVEMCACMETSRMVQATAAVQLFVQRCFLSLESEVTVDVGADSAWLQWQWMSHYRVWQANREVFLFPENWIDPTLRKSASPFFKELMQDVRQGELNADLAETGLQNYLEKLEQVARLDVCGVFHNSEGGADVLHVLARTQGSPPVYYMREWVGSALWGPWRKVDLDIASDHVLPVVWNGKPYIFWTMVTVKGDQNNQPLPTAKTSESPPPGPNMHLEVKLAWSQFKQGKWQAKQTAPQTLLFSGPWPADAIVIDFARGLQPSDITLKSSFNGPLLQIDVFMSEIYEWGSEITYVEVFNSPRHHVGAFVLGGAGAGVQALVAEGFVAQLENVGGGTPVGEVGELATGMQKPPIATPTATSFDGDWLANEYMSYQSAARPRVGPMYSSYQLYRTLPSELVLEQADYYRLVTPHQTPSLDSTLPFFYRDSAREYFVVPTIYYQNGNYFTINAPMYVYDPFYKAEYTFWPFYHPFAWLLAAQLNIGGIDALYRRKLQLDPAAVAGVPEFDFASYYKPTSYVLAPYPKEGIDFEAKAGYALYNWELFFHAPLLVANGLRANQQFEAAKHWYEYVFNPSSGSTDPVPQRFWVTKRFYEMSAPEYAQQQLTALMEAINKRDPELEHQVALWRADPFDPDAIAQLRPVAYQRAIVMRYIDNLIAWGDQLFTQDTMESINLATQLYVLAGDLLGPRPEVVPPRVQPQVKTYAELKGGFDVFSNELVAAENAIPPVKVNVSSGEGAPPMPSLSTLYFRIPPNTKLLEYWDTVADRLFKIRHCMNIRGVVQQLPLFAPPISPEALVAAAAAGLDLSSVLNDSAAAPVPYRFRSMIRHAIELCDQVRSLGTQLLVALEKSDAEQLARIRSSAEVALRAKIEETRATQVQESEQQIEVLAKARQTFADRASHYKGRSLMNEWEAAAMILHATALIPQIVAEVLEGTSAVAHAIPMVEAGAAGFGGSPTVTLKIGGPNVGHAAKSGAWIARMIASVIQTSAQLSATLGSYHQRQDDWTLQAQVAEDEMARIDADTTVAKTRVDVAEKELQAAEISAKEATEVDEFLHGKFTNKELYDWMVGQTSNTYFQAYQLAYQTAKVAERCYRRELAVPESDFIQFGYWDSLRQGLGAGEKLHFDLRRLESAYVAQNERELEIVKHVSLLQLDPYQLVALRQTGTCTIDLPELLFDLDNPGHYMRRIKTVSLTLPCVVGPYASVSATLTLLANQIRVSTDTGSGYERSGVSDTRFLDDPGGTSEIVTSSAQTDSGLFELRLEDERYLPFESAGAVSSWRLTLNNVYPQFDYSTITDVVLHVRYTARDGGAPLASVAGEAARSHLNSVALAASRTGLYRLFSARHEYASQWAQFLEPAAGQDQVLTLAMAPERFQFFTSGLDLSVRSIDVLAKIEDTEPYTLVLTTPASHTQTLDIDPDGTLQGMYHVNVPFGPHVDLGRAPTPSSATPPTWTLKLKRESASDFHSLSAANVHDVLLVVSYEANP